MKLLNIIFMPFLLLTATVCKTEQIADKQNGCNILNKSQNDRLYRSIDLLRESRGLPPFSRDPLLIKAARDHAFSLAQSGKLYHTDKKGGPLRRLIKMGLMRASVGENIARMPPTPQPGEAAVNWWQSGSKSELENLIAPHLKRIGAAMTKSGNYCYCVVIITD